MRRISPERMVILLKGPGRCGKTILTDHLLQWFADQGRSVGTSHEFPSDPPANLNKFNVIIFDGCGGECRGEGYETETACDGCTFGKQVRERQYHCSHPKYGSRGKVIYPETFTVLKKLGCGGAQSRLDAAMLKDHQEQYNGKGIRK